MCVTWDQGFQKRILRTKNTSIANVPTGHFDRSKLFAAIDEILIYWQTILSSKMCLPQIRGVEKDFTVDANKSSILVRKMVEKLAWLGQTGEALDEWLPIKWKRDMYLVYARYPGDGRTFLWRCDTWTVSMRLTKSWTTELSRLHYWELIPGSDWSTRLSWIGLPAKLTFRISWSCFGKTGRA